MKSLNQPLKFSPSGLTHVNCKRCFYLSYNYGINYSTGFPGVFSTLDIAHKNRFQDLPTKKMFSKLPDGKFYKTVNADVAKIRKKKKEPQFKEMELPSFIKSSILKDNKSREFFLAGKPDLVVKFDDGTYGILDFKTTSEDDKTQAYKHQLEAYAQIFQTPGATGVAETPKLFPISYMGLIQFTPKDIFEHNDTIEQPDGDMNFEPIDGGDNKDETSYESVELELEIPDFETDFNMPDMDIGPPPTMVEIKMEATVEADIEMELAPKPEMEVTSVEVVAEQPVDNVETTEEAPPEPEIKEEPTEEPKTEVKKLEPKKEVKPEAKEEKAKPVVVVKKKVVKPKTKVQKKKAKEKAGSKIIKKMGDKNRYDSSNQIKTLIVMQVLGGTKEFFSAQTQLPDIQGFFSNGIVPDSIIKDNNFASFMLKGKSHIAMNALIDSQYK